MSDTRILPISELQYEDMILQGLSKCMKISKKKFNQKQAGLLEDKKFKWHGYHLSETDKP